MEPDFTNMDLFCRINVQAEMSFQEFVAFIARCAGGPASMNSVRGQTFDLSVFENDDFDTEKSHTGKDRWLHFRYTLEVDPVESLAPQHYVAAISAFLQSLWSSGMDAVASCDFEEQLPRNVRRLKWARIPRPDGEGAGGTETMGETLRVDRLWEGVDVE